MTPDRVPDSDGNETCTHCQGRGTVEVADDRYGYVEAVFHLVFSISDL